MLGGESMTPEQVAAAEKKFEEAFSIPWAGAASGEAEPACSLTSFATPCLPCPVAAVLRS